MSREADLIWVSSEVVDVEVSGLCSEGKATNCFASLFSLEAAANKLQMRWRVRTAKREMMMEAKSGGISAAK